MAANAQIKAACTMHGCVIRELYLSCATPDHTQLLETATAIQMAWGSLDKTEQMLVETLLAWAVTYDGQIPALFSESQARTASSFSLRNPVIRTSPGTIDGIAALISDVIADAQRADRATRNGQANQTLRSMQQAMDRKYPELGLTFGYVGNCDLMSDRWDDRSWKFFTKCATPACHNACDVSFGGVPTTQMGRLMIQAERELDDWCAQQQQLLADGEIRRVGA